MNNINKDQFINLIDTLVPLYNFVITLQELEQTHGEAWCNVTLTQHLSDLSVLRQSAGFDDDLTRESFRHHILPLLFESPFIKHCYDKPHGYPGDHIAQELIWLGRTQPQNHRYSGRSRLGKLLNALTLDMPNCRANEERIYILKEIINTSGARIASIGCGSSIENWSLQNDTKKEALLLVDQDPKALSSAQANIKNCDPENITAYQGNVLRFLLAQTSKRSEEKYNLVYCFGMFDYFTVQNAKKIVSLMRKMVAEGGKLVIVNAHTDSPSKLWVEYSGDWWLIYKNQEEMMDIIADLHDIKAINYFCDSFNVYQYLVIDFE